MKMHDTIIKSLEHIYRDQRGATTVLTNLKGEEAVVKGVVLDLIVKNPFLMHIKVETESTVNEGSAIAWKQISDTIGTFWLMVPEPLRAEAVRIIKKKTIKNVRMCAYKVVENKLKFINIP